MFAIDHIGIAVRDLKAAVACYRDALGMNLVGFDDVASQGVHVAFLEAGESRIELLEPVAGESAVSRFLSRRGEGIHHLCLQVESIEEVLQRLKEAGVPLVNDRPISGAHGRKVAFVHPRGTHGVLLELAEPHYGPDAA